MKKQLIKTYFNAIENKDINSMKEVLTPEIYGIRTFLKDVHYDFDSFSNAILSLTNIQYSNISIETNMNTAFAYATLTEKETYNIIVKFTFKDRLISKVYETINDPNTTRIKCNVMYDGSRFNGFQKQPNLNTIQGTIESVLHELTGEEITIHASGRTDKGVHALGQVFHFDTTSNMSPNGFLQQLNKRLPESIQVSSCEAVNKTFHSRYDVKTKEYMYLFNLKQEDFIQKQYEWYPKDFDISKFKTELQSLKGTHDFTSFTKTNNEISKIRTIYSVKIETEKDKMKVYIKGNGFLRYMVRNIIEALIKISNGSLNTSIKDMIEAKDNTILKSLAPSNGLYLNEVTYHE